VPRPTRRELLLIAAGGARALRSAAGPGIDRASLVGRHSPRFAAPDFDAPLSVGNGEFAFTADFTGLQTFPDLYENSVPLCTQAQWGWHSYPIPDGLSPQQLRLEMFDTYGRPVGYATSSRGQEPLFNWLRENPHRLNLARIGLWLDGKPVTPGQFHPIEQKLDLWTGTIESKFELLGQAVRVRTCCHPELDALAVQVDSALLPRLAVVLEFPYGSTDMNASDWNAPQRHRTAVADRGPTHLRLDRQLDGDRYAIGLQWNSAGNSPGNATLEGHRVTLTTAGPSLALTCHFSPQGRATGLPIATDVFVASARHWGRFWATGGAIDLSGSADPRAQELERRVVLSQYLTAIQCAGSLPPQETGLTCNSWYGKFHLEMHWWHAAHFSMWGRANLLERSLPWYSQILPQAREKARRQGYQGVRWPKMTSPDAHDSPSAIGEMLIWQQPHPILYAEASYAAHPDRATLQRYRDVVLETAEFMASYAVERDGRYMLGPPVIPAQENHPARETWNPTYELAYWKQALGIAQTWRERLGLARVAKWDDVRRRLAAPTARDGVYLAHENCPQTFTERNRDHPSMLYAFGMLEGEGIDRETMRRTLGKVLDVWKWDDTWGWDFPAIAMTAARLNEPALAIDALFLESPKNTWRANGHNWQRANLPLYLPGNGALLSAVAMMAAGWQGGPKDHAPGFPKKRWNVRWEALKSGL
jgi:protein-glucosylgalactosylhydroxylysine glucosidase